LRKFFETKHNIVSKISMTSADDLLGCPKQIDVWRGSRQPASLIRPELGFDKPSKIREVRRAIRHVGIMQKRWRLHNVVGAACSRWSRATP
jgi:hypothetical protein